MTNLEYKSNLEQEFILQTDLLEACKKIEKFLRHSSISGKRIRSLSTDVDAISFAEAVGVLVKNISGSEEVLKFVEEKSNHDIDSI